MVKKNYGEKILPFRADVCSISTGVTVTAAETPAIPDYQQFTRTTRPIRLCTNQPTTADIHLDTSYKYTDAGH